MNCPYRVKHVPGAVEVIKLMIQNSTNTYLLQSYKMIQFIYFFVFLNFSTG
jgi:hypothetical protein